MAIGDLTKALQAVVDETSRLRDYDIDRLRGWCEEQAENPDHGRIRQATFRDLAGVLREHNAREAKVAIALSRGDLFSHE